MMQMICEGFGRWKIQLARAHSEGDCQHQTNGEGESIFLGKMGMRHNEGNLCSKLGSSFMVASIIFPISSFVM
jgi:hypothetical protein